MTADSLDPQALLIDKRQVARMTSLSTRTIDRLVATGEFPAPVRLGRRRLWHRPRLEAWLAGGGQGGRF